MKKIIYILFVFLLLTTYCFAQKLTLEASKTKVTVGEPFQVTFTLNENGSNLKINNINEFDLLQGPYTSSSTTIINGSMSQTTSLTYIISAKKEGKFTLGPGVVSTSNGSVTSNALNIEVVKAGNGNAGNSQKQGSGNQGNANVNPNEIKSSSGLGNNLYITTTVDKNKAFIGEVVTITYKIYTRVEIRQLAVSKVPSVSGSFVEDAKVNSHQETVIIDGHEYVTAEIKKSYIIPQRTGKITIEPLEAECVVRMPSNNRPRDIFEEFFGTTVEETKHTIKSKAVTLDIQSLPEQNKPENFTGAVGEYSMKASVNKDTVKANDAINLSVTIQGKGNIKLIDPLKIKFPTEFETYEPKISQNINSENSSSGSKTFEYVIVPRKEGEYKLHELGFNYFDPNKKKYITLPSPELNIYVKKGDEDKSSVVYNSSNKEKEDIKVFDNDIRYIKPNNTTLTKKNNYFFGSPLFYASLAFPLLAFLGFLLIRKKSIENNKDVVAVKNRNATRMAKKRLTDAEKSLQNNKKEQFFIDISQALYGYASDKLNISLNKLSKDNIAENLKIKGAADTTINSFIDTLNQCEYARYAPAAVSDDLKAIYNNTVNLITKVESELSSKI